ncbi:glycoside hydrolase family 43 protein [Microbacterium halophytorum]|uniref:glycoside hydrolase family 43 protein n=1 Tax=Microbacterium halophytorum TaxID=2067568 RepID=UPI001E332C87|nr:glycoside hydrolase 43 family protein [Microbacterium halophytorum]
MSVHLFPWMLLRRAAALAAGVALLVVAGVVAAAQSAQAAVGWEPEPSYTTTDNGDGTYSVPLLNADVPDVSVERVPAAESDEGRDVYYMISTTMQLSPGAPIMKSYDLVNWEIVNYVFDRLSAGDEFSLRDGESSYGRGQWASSLRYHDGTYYVVVNTLNLGGAFVYTTEDIEDGAWTRTALGRSLHDPSLFFDEKNGGTPYVFYGGVSAVRLNADLTAIEQDYPDVIRRSDYADEPYVGSGGLFEGAQVFAINGQYYVAMITWPSSGRQVALFRSDELLGRLADDPAPYESRGVLNSNGFAQGSLVPVADGAGGDDWHGFFFRDTFPQGRIPALIPATWEDGWPTFGDAGTVPVKGSFAKPIRLSEAQERFERQKSIVASDDFDNDAPRRAYQDEQWDAAGEGAHPDEVAWNGSNLDPAWQWNHAPDNRYWSLTDRDGWLRLTAGSVVTGEYEHRSGDDMTWLEEARNTLSQRTFGPRQSVEAKLDVSGMHDGDVAGLAAYNRDFSYVGVKRVAGEYTVGVVHRGQPFSASIDHAAVESFLPGRAAPLGDATEVHLKADLDFASVPGQLHTAFSYSLDGREWHQLGDAVGPLHLDGSLTHFMGHRVGLFDYATQSAGGHVDVDHFLLSDTLASQGEPLDAGELDAAIAHAATLDEADYPPAAWSDMQGALAKAEVAATAGFGTQNQIDAPARALNYQLARLGALAESAAMPEVSLEAGTRCVAGRVVIVARLANDSDVPVTVALGTASGSASLGELAPGEGAARTFSTRSADVTGGTVTAELTASVGSAPVSWQAEAAYGERSCA